MTIDITLIKPDNIIATGPTTTNTAIPVSVEKHPLADTNETFKDVWEYTFSSEISEVGAWVISVNTDDFVSIGVKKGDVIGTLNVLQGNVYTLALNWEKFASFETLKTEVATLKSGLATANTTIAALNKAISDLNRAASPALVTVGTHTTQIAALTARISSIETKVDALTPPTTPA